MPLNHLLRVPWRNKLSISDSSFLGGQQALVELEANGGCSQMAFIGVHGAFKWQADSGIHSTAKSTLAQLSAHEKRARSLHVPLLSPSMKTILFRGFKNKILKKSRAPAPLSEMAMTTSSMAVERSWFQTIQPFGCCSGCSLFRYNKMHFLFWKNDRSTYRLPGSVSASSFPQLLWCCSMWFWCQRSRSLKQKIRAFIHRGANTKTCVSNEIDTHVYNKFSVVSPNHRCNPYISQRCYRNCPTNLKAYRILFILMPSNAAIFPGRHSSRPEKHLHRLANRCRQMHSTRFLRGSVIQNN